MVKVGILEAETPLAGELIRILVNHPETDLVTLYSPPLQGYSVTHQHHGLIGETPLNFTDKLILEDLDFLIIQNDSEIARQIIKSSGDADLKIVSLVKNLIANPKENVEIGLSEINRKALVRTAKKAFLPAPDMIGPLITLAPLASFLLLNSDLNIEVFLPEDILKSFDKERSVEEISFQLKRFQNSFNGAITLTPTIHPYQRTAVSKITINNNLPLSEIEDIYERAYDDHNFTFLTSKELRPEEVEGTQKVLIHLSKPSADTLEIESIYDPRMRSGAGDIVHVMNLFFGLHEKTGLSLKSSCYVSK